MSSTKRIRAAILMQEGEFTLASLLRDFPRFNPDQVTNQLALARRSGEIAALPRHGRGQGQGTYTTYVRVRRASKDPEDLLATLMHNQRYDDHPRSAHLFLPSESRNPLNRPHV